jgi:hypothetical protein
MAKPDCTWPSRLPRINRREAEKSSGEPPEESQSRAREGANLKVPGCLIQPSALAGNRPDQLRGRAGHFVPLRDTPKEGEEMILLPGVPEFVSEIIEGGFRRSGRGELSFIAIFETLEANTFRIVGGVDSEEVFACFGMEMGGLKNGGGGGFSSILNNIESWHSVSLCLSPAVNGVDSVCSKRKDINRVNGITGCNRIRAAIPTLNPPRRFLNIQFRMFFLVPFFIPVMFRQKAKPSVVIILPRSILGEAI